MFKRLCLYLHGASVRACMRAYMHACVRVCARTRTHTHTHTQFQHILTAPTRNGRYGWVYVAFAALVLGFRSVVFGVITRAMARKNARRRCSIFAKLLAHTSPQNLSVAEYCAEGQAKFRVVKVRQLLILSHSSHRGRGGSTGSGE